MLLLCHSLWVLLVVLLPPAFIPQSSRWMMTSRRDKIFKQGIAIQSCDKQPGANEARSVKHSTVRRVSLVESAARSRPLWRGAKSLPRLAVSNINSPSDTQVKCTASCLRWTPNGLGLWSRDLCHGTTPRHLPNHSMILLQLEGTINMNAAQSRGDKQYFRAPTQSEGCRYTG